MTDFIAAGAVLIIVVFIIARCVKRGGKCGGGCAGCSGCGLKHDKDFKQSK